MSRFNIARCSAILFSFSSALACTACNCSEPQPFVPVDATTADGSLLDATLRDANPIDGTLGDGSSGDGSSAGGQSVKVVMTADNAYGFGWGSNSSVDSYFGRPEVVGSAEDIFSCPIGNGPEAYEIPADQARSDQFVYIVAWNDRNTTQGVLGQFYRQGNTPLYTGNAAWEVCATGMEYDVTKPAEARGPELEAINREVAKCNAGSGDRAQSSAGWVSRTNAITANALGRLEVGEDNSTEYTGGVPQDGNEFPVACQMDSNGNQGIDAAAKWMWYRAPGDTGNPFRWSASQSNAHPGGNYTRQFLIFRLPVEEIIIL